MKTILGVCGGIVLGFVVGYGQANHEHAGDYARGFSDGWNAPHTRAPSREDRVVSNLFCKYAELACARPTCPNR